MESVVQPWYRAMVESLSLELLKSVWMWPLGTVVSGSAGGMAGHQDLRGFSNPNDSMIPYSLTLPSLVLFPSRRTWSSWCRS